MRVFLYQFFPGGGIGRYTHELARHLAKQPATNLSVICSPDYEWLDCMDYDVLPILPSLKHRTPTLRRAKFLAAQFESPRRLFNFARNTPADIIHFCNINHLTFPLWRRWIPRQTAIAATVHDVRRDRRILNREWETRALQKFYRRADALFLHSSQQKCDLLDFANVREDVIHQVPMGTMAYAEATGNREASRNRFGIPQSRFVGLFFGNIRDDKNLDGLLTAISLQKEPIFLVIAGQAGGADNKNSAFYRQRINSLGLDNHVLFLDRFIEHDEVADLFEACDFVPLSYRINFTSQSSVLNVAMHYHKPVVASPAPTLAETVRKFDIGVVTDSDSPESLLAGIKQLLSRIQSGARFEFDKYQRQNSWDGNARIAYDVYQSLLEKKSRQLTPEMAY